MTGEPITPEDVLRALADPERLAVAGLLALGPRTAEDIADASGIPLARVRRHLTRLASSGIASYTAANAPAARQRSHTARCASSARCSTAESGARRCGQTRDRRPPTDRV